MTDTTRTTGLPAGTHSLNPFAVVDHAAGLISFITEVFGGRERPEARTPTPSGALIHAEVQIGDAVLLLADRLPGWPPCPALLQVYVVDAGEVLRRATDRGARVVTEVTPFYGGQDLARLADPWGNLWWLYAPAAGRDAVPHWQGGTRYVFDSLDAELRRRGGAGR